MKALLLSDEGEELAEEVKDVALIPIVKNIPHSLEPVKDQFRAGFIPFHNIFLTKFSVDMVERLEEFRGYALKGAIAPNIWILNHLRRIGIPAELIPRERISHFISNLGKPYAIWCSNVEEPLKVGEEGRIFVVHDIVEDDKAFPKLIAKINEGVRYVIFTSSEEVHAWEKLEELYGGAEEVWAVAVGKAVAALIQNYTSITKILVFEGRLDELPDFLRLFGVR